VVLSELRVSNQETNSPNYSLNQQEKSTYLFYIIVLIKNKPMLDFEDTKKSY